MASPSKEPVLLPSLGGTLGFGEAPTEVRCDVCNKVFVTLNLYDKHLSGQTHKAALQKIGFGRLGGCEQHYSHIEKILTPVKPRIES